MKSVYDYLKALRTTLTDADSKLGECLDVQITLNELDMFQVDVVFSVTLPNGESDLYHGQSLIDGDYFYKFDDDRLTQQILGDIIYNYNMQVLSESSVH